ncbi:hypothetical protein NCAS_0B03540 [Naumovozyma castellii]|uniref:Uncharacterized protein n=1 Tax=Naumovozyma castellii TaxID=27288 RepID=G0VBW1_NAUCA|nr:hypothetical protein NCAS_0B03540 [Naumovozyma castellii CBS 4309]CCC68438.1 hypothetical protein NCAS_0B03540 [Naumovozyma castellii CBS 4309]
MSLPLKPFTIDSHSKHLDSKQKKFQTSIQRALERFDSVTEWADYIASLGTLLKALQSWTPKFQNVKYYVPEPYQVSRRLTSSLSPSLPAGVHQKTLEVYTFIFENIGRETLSAESNIWVPGILPLMSYASMTVKSHLIELYEKYLVVLPSDTLKLLIRPLLASLFPGIDDESNEFLPLTMRLIETLKNNLKDDSLFWQTTFLVITTSKDRRLGGLVWLTKKFPSLNEVPHLVAERNKSEIADTSDKKNKKETVLSTLLPEAKSLVSPEPGMLIRCMVRCLDDENDLLIKRGLLDLLVQRLRIDSPVLVTLANFNDTKLLVLSCCKTALNKDMSLNRRIWNWLLGPATGTSANNLTKEESQKISSDDLGQNNEYFSKYGFKPLIEGLNDMLEREETLVVAFKICLAVMDRWEIGSLIIPEMFIKLLIAAKKFSENQNVIKAASSFFDAVETNIIWGKMFEWLMVSHDLDFLQFVISTFNVSNDEEIIVRHLPLMLLAVLSFPTSETNSKDSSFLRYDLCKKLLDHIPERAFLPLNHSSLNDDEYAETDKILDKILNYYKCVADPLKVPIPENPDMSLFPFSSEDLTFLIFRRMEDLLIDDLVTYENVNAMATVFILAFEKIPSQSDTVESHPQVSLENKLIQPIFQAVRNYPSSGESNPIIGIVNIYSNYLISRMPFIDSMKLLKLVMERLWCYMKKAKTQSVAINCLKSLERCISSQYIESALSNCFVKEKDVTKRLAVLDLLWTRLGSDTSILNHPLQLIMDELFDNQNPYYLSVSKWISLILSSGSSNRFYKIMVENILNFQFFERGNLIELDDLDAFTYYVQSLTNVLKTNSDEILKNFGLELTKSVSIDRWPNEDTSTYKTLMIVATLKFLDIKQNNHVRSIRSSLILLDCLLDGSESNFKDIVIFLLHMSSNYINGGELESELIAVSLLDIVSKVLRLSHANTIKLNIFDDNATHLKYIDYLVTSVTTMEAPLVVASYVNLLSESTFYFEQSIFTMILPLTSSLVQSIQRLFTLFKQTGSHFESISLFMRGIQDLLQISHGYLTAAERDGTLTGAGSKGDFFQSVVSNVFYSESSTMDSKLQGERDVILQCFKQVIKCCLDIWCWSHEHAETSTEGNAQEVSNYNAYKFKFKSKELLEKLFFLEPSEVLETMISLRDDESTVTLIHVLDGNKPAVSIPYIFSSVISRYNRSFSAKFSVSPVAKIGTSKINGVETSLYKKLSGVKIMHFLLRYVVSLENSSIEEFYGDFIIFFKEVSTNYSFYNEISLLVLKFVSIIAEKIARSQFGEQKRIRRDIADTFMKYISNALSDSTSGSTVEPQTYADVNFLIPRISSIVNENVSGDKFGITITTIVTKYISPALKNKGDTTFSSDITDLILTITKYGSKVKLWRNLLNDFFQDDKKLHVIGTNPIWREIILEWTLYADIKARLMSDLLLVTESKKVGLTPTIIAFNSWNDAEIDNKCHNFLRISYILLIAPKDTYLLHFQALISCVSQYLISKESKIQSKCWILLRAMFLRFSESHFNDFWSMITYCLQTNLQEFYESLQIQAEIDSDIVLQICKTLDLLLSLNLEGFSATNEWLFVIDTINCIYKTNPYIALADEIFETKEFESNKLNTLNLANQADTVLPLLTGIHSIEKYTQLKNFFQNLSYSHYETTYSLKATDYQACENDLMLDIFT